MRQSPNLLHALLSRALPTAAVAVTFLTGCCLVGGVARTAAAPSATGHNHATVEAARAHSPVSATAPAAAPGQVGSAPATAPAAAVTPAALAPCPTPRVQLNAPEEAARGVVELTYYVIWDERGAVDVDVEYNAEGGDSWKHATRAAGADSLGTRGLASAPFPGVRHTFRWDTARDIGPAVPGECRARVRLLEPAAGDPNAPAAAGDTVVVFVDNSALAAARDPAGETMLVEEETGAANGEQAAAPSPPPAAPAPPARAPAPDPKAATFENVAEFVMDDCWPAQIRAADFNNDGVIDLAMTNQNRIWVWDKSDPTNPDKAKPHNLTYIMPGAKDGKLDQRKWRSVPCGFFPKGLLARDLDGDGKVDLAVTNFYGGTINVFKGQGDLNFLPIPYKYPVVPEGVDPFHGDGQDKPPLPKYNPISIDAADFDGDGLLDLVVCNSTDDRNRAHNLAVFRQDPGGKCVYQAPPFMSETANFMIASVKCADFNADGWVDCAIGNYGDYGQLSVQFNNFDVEGKVIRFVHKMFTPAVENEIRGNKPMVLQVADFNADGKPDIAAAGEKSGLFVFANLGEMEFTPGEKFATAESTELAVDLAMGDLNGDGIADLAMTHIGDALFSIFYGCGKEKKGNGAFKNFASEKTPPGGWKGGPLAAADLNGDGKTDLAVCMFSARDPDHPKGMLRVYLQK
ncbi:MAG: VCBS repeat-containing protein [Planctomycetes bacterium]|nr:VCBS repeat-containing protein [Planctomycetota bacterium]